MAEFAKLGVILASDIWFRFAWFSFSLEPVETAESCREGEMKCGRSHSSNGNFQTCFTLNFL